MSFLDHIDALRWHIFRSLIVMIIIAIAVFIKIEWIFRHVIMAPARSGFISYRWMCSLGHLLHVDSLCLSDMNINFQSIKMAGQFMMSFSSSLLIGFIVSFPYIFWEFWRFIRPALKEHEVRSARGIVFWSSLLFLSGVIFSYFILVPFTINFFANYQLSPEIKNVITVDDYYETFSDMILGLGIVFELPIVIYFLSRVGIVTPAFMRKYRRYAIVIIVFVSEIITPPDWFSFLLVAVPLLILYEASISISARVQKGRLRRQLIQP